MLANGYGVSLRDDEHALTLTVVTGAHTCDYTKNHGVGHFKWVSCMLCESYLNRAV